jgi:hypothetical protein
MSDWQRFNFSFLSQGPFAEDSTLFHDCVVGLYIGTTPAGIRNQMFYDPVMRQNDHNSTDGLNCRPKWDAALPRSNPDATPVDAKFVLVKAANQQNPSDAVGVSGGRYFLFPYEKGYRLRGQYEGGLELSQQSTAGTFCVDKGKQLYTSAIDALDECKGGNIASRVMCLRNLRPDTYWMKNKGVVCNIVSTSDGRTVWQMYSDGSNYSRWENCKLMAKRIDGNNSAASLGNQGDVTIDIIEPGPALMRAILLSRTSPFAGKAAEAACCLQQIPKALQFPRPSQFMRDTFTAACKAGGPALNTCADSVTAKLRQACAGKSPDTNATCATLCKDNPKECFDVFQEFHATNNTAGLGDCFNPARMQAFVGSCIAPCKLNMNNYNPACHNPRCIAAFKLLNSRNKGMGDALQKAVQQRYGVCNTAGASPCLAVTDAKAWGKNTMVDVDDATVMSRCYLHATSKAETLNQPDKSAKIVKVGGGNIGTTAWPPVNYVDPRGGGGGGTTTDGDTNTGGGSDDPNDTLVTDSGSGGGGGGVTPVPPLGDGGGGGVTTGGDGDGSTIAGMQAWLFYTLIGGSVFLLLVIIGVIIYASRKKSKKKAAAAPAAAAEDY